MAGQQARFRRCFIALIWAAFQIAAWQKLDRAWRPPSAPFLGAIMFAVGLPWYGLIALDFGAFPAVRAFPFWVPLAAGIAWAGGAWILVSRWTTSPDWSDRHRFALIAGAMLVPMVGGFGGTSAWPRGDLIGKIVIDLLAIALLIMWRRRLGNRMVPEAPSSDAAEVSSFDRLSPHG